MNKFVFVFMVLAFFANADTVDKSGNDCKCPSGQVYFYDHENNKGYCGSGLVCPTGAVPVNNTCPTYVTSNNNKVIYINNLGSSRVVYSYGGGQQRVITNSRSEPCKKYYHRYGSAKTYCKSAVVQGNRYIYNDKVRRKMFRPRSPITVYKPADPVIVHNTNPQCPVGFVYIPSANMCASEVSPVCK